MSPLEFITSVFSPFPFTTFSTHPLVNLAANSSQTERVSSFDNDCPIFSTICITAYVKTNPKNERDKYSALDQVQRLFKSFLNLFYANQIAVCFAQIKPCRGCIGHPRSSFENLTRPVQIYAFTMLRNVGYSVEQKLYQNQSICEKLLQLAAGDDDVFYRLCLYLFRRSKEYHFLNVSNVFPTNTDVFIFGHIQVGQ